MNIRKSEIITIVFALILCIACTGKSGDGSQMAEPEIVCSPGTSEESQDHSGDSKQCDTVEADDSHIPTISIEDAKSVLIDFWKKNQEDLEKTAGFLRDNEITRISVYSDDSILVQYKDNTVTDQLDYTDAVRNVIEHCKNDFYLAGGEYKWVENGQMFVNESSYFIYKTRVYRKDADSELFFTLYLVYSENTVSELTMGFATEELTPGWMIIIVELE